MIKKHKLYVHTLLCTIWAPERRPTSDLGWKCLSFFFWPPLAELVRVSGFSWKYHPRGGGCVLMYSVQYVQNTCINNITYCNDIRLGILHKLCTRPALGPVSVLETKGMDGREFNLTFAAVATYKHIYINVIIYT